MIRRGGSIYVVVIWWMGGWNVECGYEEREEGEHGFMRCVDGDEG